MVNYICDRRKTKSTPWTRLLDLDWSLTKIKFRLKFVFSDRSIFRLFFVFFFTKGVGPEPNEFFLNCPILLEYFQIFSFRIIWMISTLFADQIKTITEILGQIKKYYYICRCQLTGFQWLSATPLLVTRLIVRAQHYRLWASTSSSD